MQVRRHLARIHRHVPRVFSAGAAGMSDATPSTGIILNRARLRSDKNVADTKLVQDKFCEQIYPATSKYRRFCTALNENNVCVWLCIGYTGGAAESTGTYPKDTLSKALHTEKWQVGRRRVLAVRYDIATS